MGFFIGPNADPTNITSVPTTTNTLIDADGEYLAMAFMSPVTDTLTKVRVHTGTVTTGGDIDFRVETVDGNYVGSGTLVGTNTNYVHTFASTDDNASFEITFTSGASLTAGTMYVIKAVRPSGSTFAGNLRRGSAIPLTSVPIGHQYIGGALGYVAPPCFIMTFSTAGIVSIPGVPYYNVAAAVTPTSGTTPDVYGNILNLPFDCKVNEMFLVCDVDAAADFKLVDSDGSTVLASFTLATNNPNHTGYSEYRFPLSSEVSLSANTDYYIFVEPTTTSTVGLPRLDFQSSEIRALQGQCRYCWSVSAKDPDEVSDFTEDQTKVYLMGVVLSSIDIPTGGGGGETARTFVV